MALNLVEASNAAREVAIAGLMDMNLLGIPAEPAADGTVIRFAKYNRSYWFAALRASGKWFVTHSSVSTHKNQHAPRTWPELLQWIGERNWDGIEVLT